MIKPFDPYHLTPAASLNRVRIVDLPGLSIDSAVKGKTGYDLVSAQALCTLIREHAASLKLKPDALTKNDRELPILFDACFDSDDPQVRDTAQLIEKRFSRNLYYLLLTLKRGDEVNRQARTDWNDSYWNYWHDIEKIWLGGGLVSSNLGKQAVDDLHILQTGYSISLDPYGDALPMVGAARCVPSGQDSALVFDFGGSFIKRARTIYEKGMLTELHRLPSLSTPPLTEDQPQQLFDFFVSTITDTWEQIGGSLAPIIPISLAAYVHDGQPFERQGGLYASLRRVAYNAQRALSEALSERIGLKIEIILLHDGTSAALTYAGWPQTAVVMIGTAMGVGFPPVVDNLCPKAEHIKIRK